MQTQNILIVEDEAVTRNTLVSLFEAEGYKAFTADNGDEMHQVLSEENIQLLIMDINLPGKNGLMLAREVREKLDLGLIFLTGRNNDIDRILGLEIGADDYLVKPFNPRELTIKARNLLHRTSETTPVAAVQVSHYKFNGWELDCDSRALVSPSGESIRLPKSEYRALKLLLDNPGKIMTREQLIKEMTGRELKQNDRTVDVTIRRLRKHFEEDNSNSPELISTIHGEGYRFSGQLDQ